MIFQKFHDMHYYNGISDAYSIYASCEIHDGNRITTEFSDNGFIAEREKFTVSGEYKKIDDVYTRKDTFINTTDEDIHINDYKYRFTFPGDEYEVYTEYNNWCNESKGMWCELNTAVEAFSKSPRTNDSHTPMLAIFNKQTKRGVVFHLYTNCAWKMSVRKQSPNNQFIFTVVEISPFDEALDLCVKKGENFTFPTAVFYEFEDKDNLDSHKLHKYLNKVHPRKKLPVIYNTWLAFFDQINFDKIASQIPYAAEIGCDYFTLDAGWFGKGERWSDCVGDWEENTTGAYFGKMREISDRVHEHGMKFGLWLEPERAVANSEIVKTHPEYFFDNNGYSCFLDFSRDDAREYITSKTVELVEKYNIDYFKFDFNDSITYDKSHNAFFNYHKGLEKYVSDIRAKYPDIYIEGCASGGFVTNINNMRLYDSVWLSDNQSVYETIRIFKDSIKHVTPAFMEKWGAFLSAGGFPEYGNPNPVTRNFSTNDATWANIVNFNEGYLDGFFAGSPIGITTDLTAITDELREKLKEVIAEFKAQEPFFRNACARVIADTNKVLAIQYETDDEVKIVVYTGSPMTQTEMTIYPKLFGKFSFDGKEYDGNGICIEMPTARNTYMFTLRRIK